MSNFRIDSSARYARSHEWVRMEEGIAVVGISDPAQDMLSDIVYIELPALETELVAGQQSAVVESVKAAEDVLAPVSGKVIEVNTTLANTPEVANSDPYMSWFYKLEPTASLEDELAALLGAEDYDAFVDEVAN